jgi:predicted nucleic acid-binding Zn ribbon protein
LPYYEFRCERCKRVETRLYKSFKDMCTEPAVRCLHDNSRMERIPSATTFAIGGSYTAKNGYSKATS